MRAERSGLSRRCRRELEHRLPVTGRLGVVREPRELGRAAGWVGERRERLLMKSDPPVRRQRLLNGEARELVAECHTCRGGREHAGGQAFVELVDDIRCERLEEPELDRGRHDRRRLEQRARRRAQARGAGEHGVPDRVRDLVLARRQHLRDEERISRRLAVELVRVDAVRLGKRRHRRRREGLELEPLDRLAARELAEHEPERVGAVELVVAVAGENESGNALDPANEQLQDVERGLVRPVQVLDDQDRRRPRPQLAA